jgi:hypothetical protein
MLSEEAGADRSFQVPLLENAMKLHAIQYFTGRLITFTDRSAREIYKTCTRGHTTSLRLIASSKSSNRVRDA